MFCKNNRQQTSLFDPINIVEELKLYLEEGHKNDTIYRTSDLQADSKLSISIKQSKLLYDISLKSWSDCYFNGRISTFKKTY